MATAQVSPGVCGLVTKITATADDAYNVALTVTSECPHIRQMAEQLVEVAILQEMRKPIHETSVYRAAGIARIHTSCPVPCAILKAVEVAAELALPADVHITIERD